MKVPWAICLASEDAASASALRLVAGIEVAEAGPCIWLRGPAGDEILAKSLRKLAAVARYEWLPDNRLRRIDARIPATQLPQLPWQPLGAWLSVAFPAAAMPATEPRPIPLQLMRSGFECEPDLLLTDLDQWVAFAASAAQVRLECLQFAADANGRVLVRGKPLPPLPGQRYVVHAGVAVPAGFEWQPAVSVEVLQRRWGIAGHDLVLWHEDNTFTRLHADQFVDASHSAIRATAEALAYPA